MSSGANSPTIAHFDAEAGFSGGEAQVFLLIEGLRRAGWRNVLICPPKSSSEARARELGIECAPVAMRNDLDGVAILALKRELERSGAALAHLHTGRATWLGGWAARLAGVPAITTRRMDRDIEPNLRTRVVYGTLTKRAVAISPAVADCLRRGGVSEDRIRMIRSAIDPESLRPKRARDEVRGELGVANQVVLLAVGALVQRKGLDVLIDALARLRNSRDDWRAWIVGDGEERASLEERVKQLDLATNVRFLGRRSDVAELLAAGDALVMPSRREGLGVAALEAMAAGRAVVASRVGGLGDAVVHGRTGLLVQPNDVRELGCALESIIGDPRLREGFGDEGRKRVTEGFLATQMVDAYIALYCEVLAESKH